MVKRPGYLSIADDLRQQITNGERPVGSLLPGITALQQHYGGVGLNQIRDAQSVLVREGLLRRSQGKPTEVIAAASHGELGDRELIEVLVSAREGLDRALEALRRREQAVAAG